MPKRQHTNNAAKQAAYRERKAAASDEWVNDTLALRLSRQPLLYVFNTEGAMKGIIFSAEEWERRCSSLITDVS